MGSCVTTYIGNFHLTSRRRSDSDSVVGGKVSSSFRTKFANQNDVHNNKIYVDVDNIEVDEEYNEKHWKLLDETCVNEGIISRQDSIKSTIDDDTEILSKEGFNIQIIVNFFNNLMLSLYCMANITVPQEEHELLQNICVKHKAKLVSTGYILTQNCKYLVGQYSSRTNATMIKKSKKQYNECPFRGFKSESPKCKNFSSSTGWIFINTANINRHLFVKEIIMHQITHHNFFGGKLCPNRVNPRRLALFFRIGSDKFL